MRRLVTRADAVTVLCRVPGDRSRRDAWSSLPAATERTLNLAWEMTDIEDPSRQRKGIVRRTRRTILVAVRIAFSCMPPERSFGSFAYP